MRLLDCRGKFFLLKIRQLIFPLPAHTIFVLPGFPHGSTKT
jgi:hypothetical protein